MAGGARVPQAERGDPVGVDVLGGALELGEGCDGAAAGLRLLVVDLEQQGLVGLDDQGPVGHATPSGVGSDGRWSLSPLSPGSSSSSATPVMRWTAKVWTSSSRWSKAVR